MIDTLIELYINRKISNFNTVENAVTRLASHTKSIPTQTKAVREYDKLTSKYKDALPATGRIARQVLEKRKKVLSKVLSITLILFRLADAGDAKATVSMPGVSGDKAKDVVRSDAKNRQEGVANDSVKARRKYGKLEQFYIGSFDLRVTADDEEFLKKVENHMMRRGGTIASIEASEFKRLTSILKSKNVVFAHLMDSTGDSYLEAVYVMNLTASTFNAAGSKRLEFDPKRVKNKCGDKVAAYYRYTTTELDLTASTFKDAIAKTHYVKNECFLNSIYDFYKDNLLSATKQRNVITREVLLKTIGKTEDEVKQGLSIEDVMPFFVQYRLQLRVFDKFYKLVHKYDPPLRNHHNKTMYCMVTDGHVYTLNHHQKRLEQVTPGGVQGDGGDDDDEVGKKLQVGENYLIREDAEAKPARMIDNIDDILRILKTSEDTDQFIKLIHRKDNLTELLYQLTDAGYSPGINFESGRITALKLEFNRRFFIIETQQLIKSAIDGIVVVDDEATYNNMSEAMTDLNNKLFLRSHISHYTEQDIDILDAYRTKPICGMLRSRRLVLPGTDMAKNLIEVDVSKAYTAAFCEITEIPIFNEFDNFKPYNGEPIEPLNLYIVTGDLHPLNTQPRNLVYGRYLKPGGTPPAFFKQPSFIKKVNYLNLVNELYAFRITGDAKVDVYIKKLIANVNIGLLEKGMNRRTAGYLFKDLTECHHFQAQHGGVVHRIQKVEDKCIVYDKSPLGLDDGLEILGPVVSWNFEQVGEPCFVLVMNAEKQLRNGFRYIKELLLQGHNHKLMQAYDLLAGAGVKVFSVKTDCFVIEAKAEAKARELLTFDQGIGTWRVSKTEDIIFPSDSLQVKPLTDVPVVNLVSRTLEVADEWDVNELCDLFEANRRVMIRAVFAGSGKSFACKAMEDRGHKVLFVCPTNKLVQNNRESGVTLNQFFGVGMSEDGGVTRMSKFNDKPYDVIVFDEIYFASVRMLAKVKRYSELNPEKIVLATGDTDQLESIDLISDNINHDTYMNHCIDTIFPNNLLLKENKRLKSDLDKATLATIKEDLFNEDIPIRDTVRRYFKRTKTVKTDTNIAFKNSTCELVAKAVRKNLKKATDYEVGEKLVCRKYLKLKNQKFNVNFEFTIDRIIGNTFTLIDESTDQAFILTKDLVQTNFIHSYCRTCHSFQGSSVDEAITIFDTDFYFVTRKWVYTALTRATDLSKVFFYVGPSLVTKEINEDDVLERYLELKVHNYKSQDLKAGRPLADNYVTKQWLFDQYGKTCPGCGDCFRFELYKGRVEGNLTADRIDCEESHHLNNIAPLCTTCNQKKSCWD